MKWDLLIILLALYNSIFVPIELAVKPKFLKDNQFMDVMSLFIDFVFFMDIVIHFKTSFINHATGDEVLNSKKIAV